MLELELLKHILVFILFSIISGVSSALLGALLDTLLDYGHIFGKVRFFKALRIAEKIGDKALVNKLKEASSKSGFFERMEAVGELCWEVAYRVPAFTAWVCPLCITLRVNFLVCGTGATLGLFFINTSVFVLFAYFLALYAVSSGIARVVIDKLYG